MVKYMPNDNVNKKPPTTRPTVLLKCVCGEVIRPEEFDLHLPHLLEALAKERREREEKRAA